MSWPTQSRLSPTGGMVVVSGHLLLVWAMIQAGTIVLPAIPQAFTAFVIAETPPRPMPPKPTLRAVAPKAPPVFVPEPLVVPVEPVNSPIAVTTSKPDAAPPAPPAPVVVADPGEVSVAPPRFDADYLDNPAPLYPAVARKLGEQGRVILRVRVSPAGHPLDVQLHSSSGYARLDQIALDTVRRWRFVPARRGSEAVEAAVLVPIQFSLKT